MQGERDREKATLRDTETDRERERERNGYLKGMRLISIVRKEDTYKQGERQGLTRSEEEREGKRKRSTVYLERSSEDLSS
jgi:hypothetical protein